ncbi:GntR family transcriptional regulator [Streptomyces roseifaciens]
MKRISAPRRTAILSAQLVESLRSHIENGGWPVGTRIPPEQALIEELGVGRSTLREAIGALVHLGLLEPRAGDGTYVRSSSELQSVMARRAGSAKRDDVLELRTVLEEYASGAAALRRSDGQVHQLRELLADAEAATAGEDASAATAVDALFHRSAVRASGNDLLIEVYDYLGTALTSHLGGLALGRRRCCCQSAAHEEGGACRNEAEPLQVAHSDPLVPVPQLGERSETTSGTQASALQVRSLGSTLGDAFPRRSTDLAVRQGPATWWCPFGSAACCLCTNHPYRPLLMTGHRVGGHRTRLVKEGGELAGARRRG